MGGWDRGESGLHDGRSTLLVSRGTALVAVAIQNQSLVARGLAAPLEIPLVQHLAAGDFAVPRPALELRFTPSAGETGSLRAVGGSSM